MLDLRRRQFIRLPRKRSKAAPRVHFAVRCVKCLTQGHGATALPCRITFVMADDPVKLGIRPQPQPAGRATSQT
jgi:hypothetical protein